MPCDIQFCLRKAKGRVNDLSAHLLRDGHLKEKTMNKLLASTLASALILSSATAHAGGPVIIEETEVVAEKPASSVGILPLLLIGVVLCVALCGGSDDDRSLQSEL
jgi:hypothetical protein